MVGLGEHDLGPDTEPGGLGGHLGRGWQQAGQDAARRSVRSDRGRVVGAYAGASRPLELALASEHAATAFARQGGTESTRSLLDQAISIYERTLRTDPGGTIVLSPEWQRFHPHGPPSGDADPVPGS